MIKIPIEISARHIHLSQKDLEILFGKGYKLKKKKELSQSGEFAAEEKIDVEKKDKKICNVRMLGPVRKETQLELSFTDAFNLGIKPPLRKSGDLERTPGILLTGPKGKVKLEDGVIVSWRHLHISPKEAKELKIKKKFISVKVSGKRSLVFHNIKVRVKTGYRLSLHLDTDEGNAAGIFAKGEGEIL